MVISRVTILITHIQGLVTLLITTRTPEPPRRATKARHFALNLTHDLKKPNHPQESTVSPKSLKPKPLL